ncbi:hypothetical protein TELCIR_19026 [Teladorsagia circumcincta]|uniref:PDZ domain-containing protein n=1 Tax=Teladorsagia circumcincta TaxID=45464 RepID=A0A2G9TQE2_TELCI|nr:hypothetical protein TELCIR_19026 [Teladorsagia circumcincta]
MATAIFQQVTLDWWYCLLTFCNGSAAEYGYNLHAERGRGQFVGMVDKGSPADLGGLRMGDRIFAVNGHSIIGESHKKEDNKRSNLADVNEITYLWRHGLEQKPACPANTLGTLAEHSSLITGGLHQIWSPAY